MRTILSLALPAVLFLAPPSPDSPGRGDVRFARVPHGGIQPEVAVDRAGVVHMVYLAGEPGTADVFYARTSDAGLTFSPPVRVNGEPGSAIATGTIRGAQIAIGGDGRVHVAWNGSEKAQPKPPVNPKTKRAGMPMLYARSTADGSAFEPQRNLMTQTTNLDGGGSIAADELGGVYVVWHAHPAHGEGGEEARRVWVARSIDGGSTFAPEVPVSDASTGVCGCCALRLFAAPRGELHLLYRSATDRVHRDVHALVSRDRGRTFAGSRVHGWDIAACPMTSMSLVAGGSLWRAWESDGQVYFDSPNAGRPASAPPLAGGASPTPRKHPRLAVSPQGALLIAWAEGTSWGRGGSLGWQAFSASGQPTAVRGIRPGVPVWSFPAVFARPDGGFTIHY